MNEPPNNYSMLPVDAGYESASAVNSSQIKTREDSNMARFAVTRPEVKNIRSPLNSREAKQSYRVEFPMKVVMGGPGSQRVSDVVEKNRRRQ